MTIESLKNTYLGYHLEFHKLRNSYNDISKTTFGGGSEEIKLIPLTLEQNSQLALLFPATALGVFSIQLGLKFLLFKNHGTFPKTHNLQTLFELLPESLKASIVRFCCETIKISSNEFACGCMQ
jgi:HEPN domain